jgi:hypothetical protein
LHVALEASQYWLLAHVSTSSEERPLFAHCRTVLPEQKRALWGHSSVSQAPARQLCFEEQSWPPLT